MIYDKDCFMKKYLIEAISHIDEKISEKIKKIIPDFMKY